MSWEERRRIQYYYRKVRAGGRVRSEYVGGGMLGQLCAAWDDMKRLERADMRAAENATREAEAEIDRQVGKAESTLAALTRAALVAAGFHQHRGQWRKKRHAK